MWRRLFFIYLFLNWCWGKNQIIWREHCFTFSSPLPVSLLDDLFRHQTKHKVALVSILTILVFPSFSSEAKKQMGGKVFNFALLACGQIGFLGLSFSAIFGKSSFLEICNFAFSSARLSQLCDWKNKESQFHGRRNVLKQETWPEYFFTPYITQDRQLWFQIKRTIQNPRRVAQNKNWTLYSVQHPFLLISRVV